MGDCKDNPQFCAGVAVALKEHAEKLDSIEQQIYIVSGALGGVALFLLIIVIVLAVQLAILRKKAASNPIGNPKIRTSPNTHAEKKNFTRSANGNNMAPHSYAHQPQPNSMLSAEEELAQLGYSAYTGQSRGLSPSALSTSTAGGVRVLPRSPPVGFRHNQGFNNDF